MVLARAQYPVLGHWLHQWSHGGGSGEQVSCDSHQGPAQSVRDHPGEGQQSGHCGQHHVSQGAVLHTLLVCESGWGCCLAACSAAMPVLSATLGSPACAVMPTRRICLPTCCEETQEARGSTPACDLFNWAVQSDTHLGTASSFVPVWVRLLLTSPCHAPHVACGLLLQLHVLHENIAAAFALHILWHADAALASWYRQI